jgi:hypothetical protein
MRRAFWMVLCFCLVAGVSLAQYGKPADSKKAAPAAKSDFEITANYIEACSCDQFCPCYFGKGTEHGGQHFCKFNNVLIVDKGHYKTTKLDGVKVWLAGDLGAEWPKGKADWLVVNFDPSVNKEQQAAMTDILFQLYPLKWEVKGVDTVPITWEVKGDTAHAKLGNGKGEVILERFSANNNDPKQEVVIKNLKYWGAQSNDGFQMWRNKRNYYEGHGQKYEFNGTNGFRITIHFSGQAKKAATAD